MATPSAKAKSYVTEAQAMDWPKLQELWSAIKKGKTKGWDEGKALEHLIVRAFELGLGTSNVEYPYDVPPGGNPVEQIDGIVFYEGLAFLIECKDKKSNDVVVITKMRHQLERRPSTTFGCIFAAGAFTEPALLLTDMTPPQRVLLWQLDDIEKAVTQENFVTVLQEKYRHLCRFGMTDYSPFYRTLEVL